MMTHSLVDRYQLVRGTCCIPCSLELTHSSAKMYGIRFQDDDSLRGDNHQNFKSHTLLRWSLW